MAEKMILARCGSHRARARLFSRLGRKPQGYYSFRRSFFHGLYEITADEVAKIKGVTGVTIYRGDQSDLLMTWDGGMSL